MNLILFAEKADDYILPTRDPRFGHVRGVLRMGVGDRFMVGAVNGPRGDATIEEITENAMRLSVKWDPQTMSPPPRLHLLMAIPRPATARKVLFDATTLGVARFHFFRAKKSDPAYQQSRLWQGEGWREHVWQGAEQAFSTILPSLSVSDDLDAALNRLEPDGTRLALDNYEATSHLADGPPPSLPLTLALGGERGWSSGERTALRNAQFELRSLGDRVLRVETAVTATLAIALSRMHKS